MERKASLLNEAELTSHLRARTHTHAQRYGVYGVRATNLRAGVESQQIVATRPLYCLQYPASTKSSAKD